MSATLKRMRDHIFEFYKDADPEKLREGVDINGMAQWTIANGEGELNKILQLQYKKQIDFTKPPTPQEDQVHSFEEFDTSESDLKAQRAKLRKRLEEFYLEVDPEVTSAEIGEFVETGMKDGEEKLNETLMEKYGEGLFSDTESDEESEVAEFDELKVKQELRIFYKKHDSAYLENVEKIDQVIDMMRHLGKDAVYEKLEKFYNESVEDVVRNHKEKANNPLRSMKTIAISVFDDIDGLRRTLTKYYKKHDPEEVENIDDVIELGMDIGYKKLNENMEALYGESLTNFLKPKGPAKKSKLRMQYESKKNLPKVTPQMKAKFIEEDIKKSEKKERPSRKVPPTPVSQLPPTKVVPPPIPQAKAPAVPFASFSDVPPIQRNKQPSVDFYGSNSNFQENELPKEAGTPMFLKPPTLQRDPSRNTRESPSRTKREVPKTPVRGIPEVPSKTKRMPSARAVPPVPSTFPEEHAERAHRTPPKTPARNSVTKEELITFYNKHDVAKLSLINKIMKVSNRIGRKKMNTKLMGFYGADLDTYLESPNEEIREKSIKNVAEFSKTFYAKSKPKTPKPQQPFVDIEQLRTDLIIFYQKYDLAKLDVLEEIVQLGKRLGRDVLAAKLEAMYGVHLDDVVAEDDEPPSYHTRELPKVTPRSKPARPARELPEVKPRTVKPETSNYQPFISPMTEFGSDPSFNKQELRESKKQKNLQRLQQQGVPLMAVPGLSLREVKLKSTGLDTSRTLNKKKKKERKVTNSLYVLPRKKRKRRYTGASLKLLSVNFEKPSAKIAGGGNLADFEAKNKKPEPKVSFDALFSDTHAAKRKQNSMNNEAVKKLL